MKMATKELVDCTGPGAITIYTEEGQFGLPVFATVATVHYRLPERVIPLTVLHAISLFYVLASRTELLHTDEIRYFFCSLARVHGILGSVEIIGYV